MGTISKDLEDQCINVFRPTVLNWIDHRVVGYNEYDLSKTIAISVLGTHFTTLSVSPTHLYLGNRPVAFHVKKMTFIVVRSDAWTPSPAHAVLKQLIRDMLDHRYVRWHEVSLTDYMHYNMDAGSTLGIYHLWRNFICKGAIKVADDIRRLCDLNVDPLTPNATQDEINKALLAFSAMERLGVFDEEH